MTDEEDYPALIPLQNLGLRATNMDMRITEMEHRCNVRTKMVFGFMERDVPIITGEILKWSVNKRGDIDGEGRQFFDSNPDVWRMVLESVYLLF